MDITDDHIVDVIKDYLKNSGFHSRKLTDTPTDANQVTPKKYVDSQTASVFSRMYLSGAQTVAVNSPNYEKVLYDTTSFSQGMANDTTNHRIVASVAGAYQVMGFVQYEQPNTTGTVCAAAIYKNSSLVSTTWQHVAAAGLNLTPIVSDVVQLNVNDFVEIFTTKSFSDGLLQSGAAQTYVTVAKI